MRWSFEIKRARARAKAKARADEGSSLTKRERGTMRRSEGNDDVAS